MPFDDSSNSFESQFKPDTEHLLVGDKNYRIVKEQDSQRFKSSLMMYLLLVTIFLFICGVGAMIEPMVLYRV